MCSDILCLPLMATDKFTIHIHICKTIVLILAIAKACYLHAIASLAVTISDGCVTSTGKKLFYRFFQATLAHSL